MPGYGTPLSLTLPTPSVDTEAVAASKLNTALSAIIARLESKVAATDLDVASDVSFKSGAVYSGARDLQRAAFQSQAGALTAVSNPNTVYVLNGDLHYIDQAGNLIQITASGAVNVSTTGGVTGAGYGTGGVEVNWDSVNTRFRMRSGAGVDSFADVQCADLILNDASGNNIRFQAPAIASDYTLTLPAALPASTLMLQLSAAGLVTASNTVGQPVTFSGATTFSSTAALNGAVTAGSTMSVAGLLSAVTGIAVGTNQNVTVQGTGSVKHGLYTVNVSGAAAETPDGVFQTSGGQWLMSGGGGNVSLLFDLPLTEGDRVLSVEVMSNGFGQAGTRTVALVLNTAGSGTATVVTSTTDASTGSSMKTFNLADTVLGNTGIYSVKYTTPVSDGVAGIRVNYDRP